jgi:putative lipoprotein
VGILILTLSLAHITQAQAPEGQEYIVQPGDRLSQIARQFLGNANAYPAIVEATNTKAAEDSSFAVITDPNLIEAGQKLWLPAIAAPAGFTGVYTATLPAASSPGRDITMSLNADGTVERSTDYLNGKAPIVETGTWQDNGDGTATVNLTGRPDGVVYEAPDVIKFKLEGAVLTAVEYDQSLYGSEGLILQKQIQAAAPTPQPEAVVGIYKTMTPASSPGIDSTLYLNVDNTVRLVDDYLTGAPAIVEVGSWTIGNGEVVVTITGQAGQAYNAPPILSFDLSGNVLATTPAEDVYGTAGRRYLRFDPLATGQQSLPYDAAEAAQLMSTSGLAGIYKGFSPAASCCGLDLTLFLNPDHNAILKSDYLNGEAPLVETGVWTTTTTTLELALAGAESPLTFTMTDGALASNDWTVFGQTPVRLYRFEVAARHLANPFVAGSVTYQEQIALPPQAVITVQLVDVSVANAPAQVLAEQVIPVNGQQVPFAFALFYDPAQIQPGHTYAAQARIEVAGQAQFTNTTPYPVLTQDAPSAVELVLDQAGQAGAAAGGSCTNVPVTTAQAAPPDRSSYYAYEKEGTLTSPVLDATLTVEAQATDADVRWRGAVLTGLGYCAEGYAPESVTLYTADPAQTTVVVFSNVVGDDSVAAQEVRLDLVPQANNQWQVTWAGVRWRCARGANTTELTAELCP